jgi:peptide/nickel transport system ATP-binding protein
MMASSAQAAPPVTAGSRFSSLSIRNLVKEYAPGKPVLKDISLEFNSSDLVAIIGPSGTGKSTLIRCVNRLVEPTSGSILLDGADLVTLHGKALRHARRNIGMVFQEYNLVERLTVMENLLTGRLGYTSALNAWLRRFSSDDIARAFEMLDVVGLRDFANQRADALSGGQRQRVGIARALAVKPSFIVCDEAVAALDVSIQAQVLNLFMELRQRLGLTYLFISHNLAVVEHLSDRVAIMYLGRLVEVAPAEEMFAHPNHPYTQALLAEVPTLDATRRVYKPIAGELPSPLDPPSGCAFHPRCPHAFDRCRTERPLLREVAPGHISACHLNG